MSRPILVIGLPNDPVVSLVIRALQRLNANIVHWNSRHLINDIAFCFEAGCIVDGWLQIDDAPISLSDIHGVFNRLSSVELTPEYRALSTDDPLRAHAQQASATLMQWANVTPSFVMNRALANEANSTKAFQAQLIQPYFDVPDTLLTNDPAQVAEFQELHGRIIYKSCSGERSIVKEVTPELLHERADALQRCPAMFQEWIDGTDVRVHVIGDQCMATSVSSQATDYRYDASAKWKPIELPDELAAASVAMAKSMDLPLAGIDLRLSSNGRVNCFEVNPCPAFSAYEEATGQPLSECVATTLLRHH